MPEEIEDSRFKTEVMTLLGKLIAKTSENSDDLKVVRSDLITLSSDLKSLSGQFNDIGVMAIEDHKRIEILEKRVDDIETGVY